MIDKKIDDKPYDSAFKTVMYECRGIIYPLLNETFGESYDESIKFEFLNEEHEDSAESLSRETVLSDTNFIAKDVHGNVIGRFVWHVSMRILRRRLTRLWADID